MIHRRINFQSLGIGIIILIIIIYIVLNEIFWVPNADPQSTFSNTQFWIILIPGFAIIAWSFYDAFRSRENTANQSSEVKIEKKL